MFLLCRSDLSAMPLPGNGTIQVKSIDHITLVVKDLAKSRRFYVDLLGMEEVERPNFSFAGSWFQAGKTLVHLILEHDRSGPAGIFVPEGFTQSRTHHFAFEVEDAAAAEAVLNEKEVLLISGARERPDGWVQVFLNDPDGHVVELCSRPKPEQA